MVAALEDPPRRLAQRLTQLSGSGIWPSRLKFCSRLPRLDEGGLDVVRRFLDRAANPRLVCLDTLAHIRPRSSGRNTQYTDDYEALLPLQQLANERNVAIVTVHHLRKVGADDPFDEVSGTTGLTAAVDSVLTLRREAGRADAMLYGRGRDLIEFENAFAFDKTRGLWTQLGDADAYRHSEERSEILEVLKLAGEPLSPSAIAAALGRGEMDADAVRKMLARMGADLVKKVGYGKYAAV